MQIIDLTSAYVEHVLEKRDVRGYIQSYPSLFKHYFRYWANQSFFHPSLSRRSVGVKRSLILSRLDGIEKKFHKARLDVSNVVLALFVGQGTTNGHALFDNKQAIVWIPIETYSSSLQVDVFITHEIIHGLHYLNAPAFYFHNRSEYRLVSRQLITEGIATYITKQLLKIDESSALWADYLPKQKFSAWMNECSNREHELLRYIEKCYFVSSKKNQLFQANDPKDIFSYRSGYFIGLRLIGELVKHWKLTPDQLLSVPRKKLETVIHNMILSKMR